MKYSTVKDGLSQRHEVTKKIRGMNNPAASSGVSVTLVDI
jgi:hypothetical protein